MTSIIAVGSIAFDSIQAPTGAANAVLGGSLTYFALSASRFARVRMVGDRWGALWSPAALGVEARLRAAGGIIATLRR